MSDQPADKKYYTATDKSNGVDYTCTATFWIDEQGNIHMVGTKIEPAKEKQQDKNNFHVVGITYEL